MVAFHPCDLSPDDFVGYPTNATDDNIVCYKISLICTLSEKFTLESLSSGSFQENLVTILIFTINMCFVSRLS